MKEITLTKGKSTMVDDEDYELLNKFIWNAHRYGSKFRAITKKGPEGKEILMHRLIMKAPKGMEVDHINHNPLDNRKNNLRLASRADNQKNQPQLRKNNKSGYKGVSWYKPSKRWQVHINILGKRKHLGHFINIIEAAECYNKAALEIYGSFACLNIINT